MSLINHTACTKSLMMSFQLRATLALFCVALVVAAVVPASAEPIREGSYAARRNLIFNGEGQDLELLIEEPEQGELDGSLDSLLLSFVHGENRRFKVF